MNQSMRQALLVPAGAVDLDAFDPAAAPLARTDKNGKPKALVTDRGRLAGLQERLYAEATAGGAHRILLVLQGMDTAGKGGVTNHVVGAFEPIGVQYSAFKKPTAEELAHDFLWRIRKRLPEAGIIAVFDRSHYEDVLVPRVHARISVDELDRRYNAINDFERELVAGGTAIIKCFLNISYETQRDRLLARLRKRRTHWKFDEADLSERARWAQYRIAYETMLERCNTPEAPWYVVPSDSKRYRNWAVAELLRETLELLDPKYPNLHLDLKPLRARLRPPN